METREIFGKLGLECIPLCAGTKRPLDVGWQEPHPQRWDHAPSDANIGVLTGPSNANLVVFDVDQPQLLPSLFAYDPVDLAKKTVVVATLRGIHVYAWAPWSVASKDLPGKAGQIMGAGKQVVAPPSIVGSKQYRFIGDPIRIAPVKDLGLRFALTRARDSRSNSAPTTDCVDRVDVARTYARACEGIDAWMAGESPKLQERWERIINPDLQEHGYDRSAGDYAVCLSLYEHGFTPEQAVQLLLALPGSKACQDGRPQYAKDTASRSWNTFQRNVAKWGVRSRLP